MQVVTGKGSRANSLDGRILENLGDLKIGRKRRGCALSIPDTKRSKNVLDGGDQQQEQSVRSG